MQLCTDTVKHRSEIQRAVNNFKYERTDGGEIYLPTMRALLSGTYIHSVNGQDERIDPNLIPEEGINHFLAVVLGATAKISTWYHALYNGNVSPADGWTAANFASSATENTSTSEGYTGANRKTFTPGAVASKNINSNASQASFNIVTAGTLSLWGAALLSAQARGATTGVLISATKFALVRSLNNGDEFRTGYGVTLGST